MKRAFLVRACLPLAICTLVLLMSWSYAPTVHAQNPPVIQQLFGFGCDTSTKACPNGKYPIALLQAKNGDVYGATQAGGAQNSGTIFRITPSGDLRVIYSFAPDQSGKFSNGALPNSLVEGNDGFLYGTASTVVFRLSKAGILQVIHKFCSQANCVDGVNPLNLMLAADGNFYGGTLNGILFRVTPGGVFTVLHTLSISKGEGPALQGITQASDGNFYGTSLGGVTIFTTVFRLTPSGTFSILHTFHYAQFPTSAPIQGADGKLYGAWDGGTFTSNLDGSGFQTFPTAGVTPDSITQASDGNLWARGGSSSPYLPNGSIFQISPNGAVLQSLAFSGTNGRIPMAVLQARNGTLLGVALEGGSVSNGQVASGVVFKINAGLPAPQPKLTLLNPSSASAGSTVLIYGDHLLGTTKVTFNGVGAKFHVLNVNTLRTTVPAGATSGAIAVSNMGGTTVSSTDFTVN